MNKKEIIKLIFGILFLILSCIVILLPHFKIFKLDLILLIIFSIFALLKLIEFILIKKEKDYEYLFVSVISFISAIAIYFIKSDIKMNILVLLIWMGLMCFIKLKKADYYNDRKNSMWIYHAASLFIFLTSGLLMGLSLYKDSALEITIIGNFFFISSILDILDPIILSIKGDK